MKNILYIIVILLVAAAISAGTYALVENSSSSVTMEGETSPNMNSADGEMPAMPEGGRQEGGEGGEHGASFAGGMMGVLTILAKVAGITAVVALLEKAFALFPKPQVSQLTG
jgi:hypothetical protein